jgi:hypothetical protein
MERFSQPLAVLAFYALALHGAPLKAQDARNIPAPRAPQPVVRAANPRLAPFLLDGERRDTSTLIDFPAADKMNQQDRDLQASSLAAISQQANASGLNFDQGTWETQQIVCSALPNHLFLAFTRQSGTGEASAFTASIPRDGSGRVRVIPILRRGYSFFSPAPVSEQTLSAFNHIRAEEHPAQPLEWLATGLCYAALAGAHPQVRLADEINQRKDSTAASGTLTMAAGGGGEISFIDQAAASRHALWTLTFDRNGSLVKAVQSAAPPSKQKVRQGTASTPQGRPVPQSAEIHGKLVPAALEPAVKTVPNP